MARIHNGGGWLPFGSW